MTFMFGIATPMRAWPAILDLSERTHLVGDVPALVLIGAGLLVLAPRSAGGGSRTEAKPS